MKSLAAVLLVMVVIAVAVACAPKLVAPQTVYIKPIGAEKKLQAQAYADMRAFQDFKLLNFKAEVSNASNQILERAELAYALYSKDGIIIDSGSNDISYLSPGQTVIINSWTGTELTGRISKYEFTFKNIVWGFDPALYSVNNFENNPLSPGEILAAYFCFTAKADYENVRNLLSSAVLEQFPEEAVWEEENARPFSSGFDSVMIMREYMRDTSAKVMLAIYYKDGESLSVTTYFILEDGKWKIDKRQGWEEN